MEQVKQRSMAFLGGLGLGAGLMYALDPDTGPRRRAILRDKGIHAMHVEEVSMEKGVRDLGHRVEGVLARLRHAFLPDHATDSVITQRVRARLGRLVSHPGAIEVDTIGGRVRLSGPVLADEHHRLLRRIALVRGVRAVDDALEVHAAPEHVPGLQGEGRAHVARGLVLRETWTPARRMLATGAGLYLGLRGFARRGWAGGASAALGSLLLLRAFTNRPPRTLLGLDAGRRPIELQKTLLVHAPVEDAFLLWSRFENLPRFMAHVRDVRVDPHLPGRSHWTLVGPDGESFDWDATITAHEDHRLLSWKTLPGAALDHAGTIRFEPADQGRAARLHVRLSYLPPLHGAAPRLFRHNPIEALEQDLSRMKGLLESERRRAQAEAKAREV